uniref:Fibrinogen C-terminal domain-containing protein n=1 Tax=Anopheles atroparvus TaxID=41427 RepID=A0AAG5DBP3_ANOAO
MNLVGVVCCLSVAILTTPSMGRELPIGAIMVAKHIPPDTQYTVVHQSMYPKSCRDVTDRVSGVYSIQPEWPFKEPMLVYCDQDYESGGWTVIQRRIDGTVSFERDSSDYAQGFGNLNGEFWLGLENIFKLVKSAPHELVLVVEDFSGNTSYAKYSSWDLDRVGKEMYRVGDCGSYSGSAGDFFCGHLYSSVFVLRNEGGYWSSPSPPYGWKTGNLNGRYVPQNKGMDEPIKDGLHWGDFTAGSIKATKMMVRPTKPKE